MTASPDAYSRIPWNFSWRRENRSEGQVPGHRRLRRGRGEVAVERSRFLGWAPAFADCDQLDHPHMAAQRESQHLAGSDRGTRLLDQCAVDADAFLAQFCRQAARLGEAGMPQPLVET